MGLKEELAAALQPAHKDVEVRGLTVRVCGMAAGAQMEFAKRAEEGGSDELIFWMLAQSLCDPATGERLFDADELKELAADELMGLSSTVMELSKTETQAGN